jgi:hypothetical protein
VPPARTVSAVSCLGVWQNAPAGRNAAPAIACLPYRRGLNRGKSLAHFLHRGNRQIENGPAGRLSKHAGADPQQPPRGGGVKRQDRGCSLSGQRGREGCCGVVGRPERLGKRCMKDAFERSPDKRETGAEPSQQATPCDSTSGQIPLPKEETLQRSKMGGCVQAKPAPCDGLSEHPCY